MDDMTQTDLVDHSNLPLSADFTPTALLYTLLTLLLTLLATRLTSARHTRPRITSNGTRTVPQVPYWTPLLGHLPNMFWDAATFTQTLRDSYTKGSFALNFGGTTHNIIYSPHLVTALLNTKTSQASSEGVGKTILKRVFGFPAADLPKYDGALPELLACYKHILVSPGLDNLVEKTARGIKENVLFFTTATASPVDQTLWERASSPILSTDSAGEEVVEASLLPLVRDFCAHTAVPALLGSNFLTNYPDFFADLWTLDRAFLFLGTGLPRWVPIPRLTSAHIAKKRMLEKLEVFHRAMEREAEGEDPGAEWRDLEDVGDMVKARMEVYRKWGFSIRARAACELSLLWAGNANSNPLVCWLVNRIYADGQLLARLREEMEPCVRVVQPKQELAMPELPVFERFDVEGLCTGCPLLKSCYIESLRLDTASWSPKVVQEDFVLQSREKDAQGWLLRKGEYAHAAHDLHDTDPAYFADPTAWKADRHVKPSAEGGKNTAEMGSIRPYGGGSSMCKGRAFAIKEVLAFTAAIIAVWEIEPKGGGEWKMPRQKKATAVYGTNDDTRVWLKRRKLLQAS